MSVFSLLKNRMLQVKLLRLCLSILSVWLIGFYFLPNQQLGLVLVVLLTGLLELGAPIRQGILLGLAFALAVMIAGLLLQVGNFIFYSVLIGIIVLVTGVYLFNHRFITNNAVQLLNVFLLALFVYLFSQSMNFNDLKCELLAILIAVSMATFCNAFIFPFHYGDEFKIGLKPFFALLQDYQQAALTSLSMNANEAQALLQAKELALLSFTSNTTSLYPKWVFAYGFNPGLRASLRYFLLHIDQVNEIVASLTYHLPQLSTCQAQIRKVLEVNIDLVNKMQQFFAKGEVVAIPQEGNEDFFSDVNDLQICCSSNLLAQTLCRDFRDLRVVLLHLLKSIK